MTNQQRTGTTNPANQRDAGLTDLFGSMMGLASAGTKFTFKQMQNTMTMLIDPKSAMNRVKDSLDSVSNAMSGPDEEVPVPKTHSSEPEPVGVSLSGRKV